MQEQRVRILKWLGFVSLPIAFVTSYVFVSAYQSGKWLDQIFTSLTQSWNENVIIRNVAPSDKGPPQGLQTALDDLKKIKLEDVSPSACTHGLKYDAKDGLDLRSQCFVWVKFDKGVVRFEFELKRFWNQWQIYTFGFVQES